MLLTSSDSNAESTVGIMTMAKKVDSFFIYVMVLIFFYERSPEVLVTHTKDLGFWFKLSTVFALLLARSVVQFRQ